MMGSDCSGSSLRWRNQAASGSALDVEEFIEPAFQCAIEEGVCVWRGPDQSISARGHRPSARRRAIRRIAASANRQAWGRTTLEGKTGTFYFSVCCDEELALGYDLLPLGVNLAR